MAERVANGAGTEIVCLKGLNHQGQLGRSDWWWVCTDEGRLRCATLSLLSWLSVLVGFGEGTGLFE